MSSSKGRELKTVRPFATVSFFFAFEFLNGKKRFKTGRYGYGRFVMLSATVFRASVTKGDEAPRISNA